jgi:hypothetical protein
MVRILWQPDQMMRFSRRTFPPLTSNNRERTGIVSATESSYPRIPTPAKVPWPTSIPRSTSTMS